MVPLINEMGYPHLKGLVIKNLEVVKKVAVAANSRSGMKRMGSDPVGPKIYLIPISAGKIQLAVEMIHFVLIPVQQL